MAHDADWVIHVKTQECHHYLSFFCPHSESTPMFKTTIGPETSYEVLWLY